MVQTSGIGLCFGGIRAYFTDGNATKDFVSGVSNPGTMDVIEGCIFDESKLSKDAKEHYSNNIKTNVIKPIS